MRQFTLDVDGVRRPIATADAMLTVLEAVRSEHVDFAILEDNTGSYVQCAGAAGELIGEWRDVTTGQFRHHSLSGTTPDRVSVDEMATAIHQFWKTGRVADPLTVTDISARFR